MLHLSLAALLLGSVPAQASSAVDDWTELLRIRRSEAPCIDGLTVARAEQTFSRSTAEFWKWSEACRLRFRSLGLEMWARHPQDPLRFRWLSITTDEGWAPFYWRDPEEGARLTAAGNRELAAKDRAAVLAWQNRYMVLRAELMSASASPENDYHRSAIRLGELTAMFGRIGKPPSDEDVLMLSRHRLANDIWDFAAQHASDTNGNTNGMTHTWWLLESLEGDDPMESAFIEALKLNPNASVRWVAEGRDRLRRVRQEPLDLQMETLDGKRFDMRKTRGKVVLVYVWGNWCTAAISRLAPIQQLRERYGSAGFEVIGIWFSANEFAPGYAQDPKAALVVEKARAKEILQEAGATWENVALAGEEKVRFEDRYAITGTPTRWLLDRSGRLITTRHDRSSDDQLELEITRALSRAD